jgi:hypothetical protein
VSLDTWLGIGAAYLGHLLVFLRYVSRLPRRDEMTTLQAQVNDPKASPAGRVLSERLERVERAIGGGGQPGIESLLATLGTSMVNVAEQLRAGNQRFTDEAGRRHQLRTEYEAFRDLSQERFTTVSERLAEMKAMLAQVLENSRKGKSR